MSLLEEWKIGKHVSTVVSNKKQQNNNFPIPPNHTESKDDELDYYGGFLVCESIANKPAADLIASAPSMKRMLKQFIGAIEGGTVDEHGSMTQIFGPAMIQEAKRIINEQ